MKHSRLAILALSVAALQGCSGGTGVEPSSPQASLTGGGSVTVDATSSEVSAVTGSATGHQSVYRSFSDCRDPFVAPLGLIVRSTRHLNVFVREIRTRVVSDPTRLQQPQLTFAAPVTFPAPLIIQEFGTNLVHARSQRIFPLRVLIGCQFKGGSVDVDVDADDDRGGRHSGRITVGVR